MSSYMRDAEDSAQSKSEKARAALATFVPPGYDPDTPAIDFDGVLHARYDVPAERLHSEATMILRSMGIAEATQDPAPLSLKMDSGLSLTFQPVMESASNLIIEGIDSGLPAETGANFQMAVTFLQLLRNRLPQVEMELAAPPDHGYLPIVADNALSLDIGGALAILKGAGFDILAKYPQRDSVDLQVRRNFGDMESFITFARSIALPPQPQARPEQDAREARVNRSVAVEVAQSDWRSLPWYLIVPAILAIAALFFYPWQQ